MRALIMGSAALLATMASPAFASDVMANYYGNTVISKGANGEAHAHYKSDGSMDVTFSSVLGSMDTTGTWKLDDNGELCRTYNNPPPGVSASFCTSWASHQIGDTWTMDVNGQPRTITLVKGIQ